MPDRPIEALIHELDGESQGDWGGYMSDLLAQARDRLQDLLAEKEAAEKLFQDAIDCMWPDEKQTFELMRAKEAAEAALRWYGDEVEAAARYMADKDANPDALLAILTVLANDGGKRARQHLPENSDG